jgi:hypothetical protein
VELIVPAEINKTYDRVVNKDVRYRFVIDIGREPVISGRREAIIEGA